MVRRVHINPFGFCGNDKAAELRPTLPVQPPGPSPSPAPWAPWCVSSHLPLLLPQIRPPWLDPWRFESPCLGSSPWPVQPGTGTTHSSPPGSHQAFVTSDIPSPQFREQPPLSFFPSQKAQSHGGCQAVYLQSEHRLFRGWWSQAASCFSFWFGELLGSVPNQGASVWQQPPKRPKVHLPLCLLGAPCWDLEAPGAHPGEWRRASVSRTQ